MMGERLQYKPEYTERPEIIRGITIYSPLSAIARTSTTAKKWHIALSQQTRHVRPMLG